jgi:AcrR family transcriptional regulator
VVEEAGNVADDCGLANLTLAAIALRLGVRVPSLYKHVDGLAELRRLVSVQARDELAGVLARAAAGKAGGQAVTAVAGAYRAWAGEHPGRYGAAVRLPGSTDIEAATPGGGVHGVVLAALAGFRLEGEDATDAARALRAALHGFASPGRGFASPGSGLPDGAGRSFDRLVGALAQSFSTWPPGTAGAAPLPHTEGERHEHHDQHDG